MTTKEQLSVLLENEETSFLSGSLIAENLGLSRNAIWKNIKSLEADGYEIEALTNKGYKLSETNDVASENLIKKYLGDDEKFFNLEVLPNVASTNDYLKEKAGSLPEWSVVISREQSLGKGRLGRSFYSPSKTGLYLSVLLRPSFEAEKAVKITTAAAVSACLAIEEISDVKPEIKWVNDVFVEGKKVCGILTEAAFNMELGLLDWAIMGIGFNIYEPEEGFPEEIKDIAGPVLKAQKKDFKSMLTASFLKNFRHICQTIETETFSDEYKKRCFVIGRKINVIKGNAKIPATALDVDSECRLLVEYEDGKQELLSTGEVSIRPFKKEEK